MEEANSTMPEAVMNTNISAIDAWKKCTTEMIDFICDRKPLAVDKDYRNVLMENRDLKTQYRMAISVLDSIISDKDDGESCLRKREKNGVEEKRSTVTHVTDKTQLWKSAPKSSCIDQGKEEEFPLKEKFKIHNHQDYKSSSTNFKTIQKKFNECSSSDQQKESKEDEYRNRLRKPLTSCNKIQNFEEFSSAKCSQEQTDNIIDGNVITGDQILVQDFYKLKRELVQARENNITLKNELLSKIDENEKLRNQVQTLELSWKTLTEAINLQDEQLSEYGLVVTTLKNSRSQILEKMKDANARNAHNIFIMESIEKQVWQLRSQLDAYSELLSNQSAELVDKASSTEPNFVDQNSCDELMKKKDYYISLLQDRLCEAIVDLKNKDSEIKNHTTSIKSLIQNYEGEKKCLQERLISASSSVEKLEEHKIKQQETMKQLMKLVEFLQDKLEVNKK